MTAATTDQSPEYWSEYTNLQHVKHELIRHYLNGWFPKLTQGQWGAGRIQYVDTHAGRGQHSGGQLGSPLVALTTLLNHKYRDTLLRRSEIHFLFIERDAANAESLRDELKAYEPLPPNVTVTPRSGDCFEIMREVVASHEGRRLAPSFIFVDPYGFKIPGDLLRQLMTYPKVELFVNVIWRELDMAISQGARMPSGMAQTLDAVFNGPGWRNITSDDVDDRSEQCANALRRMTGARWATYIRMLGGNGKSRYFLLHLTNHEAGRDLMKECVWKTCPANGYYARKSDNPRQQMLITPEPNLAPLRDWVIARLQTGPRRWDALTKAIRNELWLPTHLNEVLRKLRREGVIEADQYQGKFAPKNNPRLRLAEKKDES